MSQTYKRAKTSDCQCGMPLCVSSSAEHGAIEMTHNELRELLAFTEDEKLSLHYSSKDTIASMIELQCGASSKNGKQFVDIFKDNVHTGYFIRCVKSKLFAKRSIRKNCDHNGFELCAALLLSNLVLDINQYTFDDICQSKLESYDGVLCGCSQEEYTKYLTDLQMRDPVAGQKWIDIFLNQIHSVIHISTIRKIYLEGKHVHSKQIKELNKSGDTNADIFVECFCPTEQQSTFTGLSIKQTHYCTLCNLSIEKMCREKEALHPTAVSLEKTRKLICEQAGITKENYKLLRDCGKVNYLFYDAIDGKNEYWNIIRTTLQESADHFTNKIVNRLFPLDLNYKVYTFNGVSLKVLNRTQCASESSLTESNKYYFKKDGNKGKQAKMFYHLRAYGNTFRVEIRFKGNILESSAQFLVYEI